MFVKKRMLNDGNSLKEVNYGVSGIQALLTNIQFKIPTLAFGKVEAKPTLPSPSFVSPLSMMLTPHPFFTSLLFRYPQV
jgi:hypothetical protein